MAAQGPDPKAFESWEGAFQYPVATVRAMERQLRSEIETNRERLRSLVGYVGCFSHLLNTAHVQQHKLSGSSRHGGDNHRDGRSNPARGDIFGQYGQEVQCKAVREERVESTCVGWGCWRRRYTFSGGQRSGMGW